MTTAQTQAPGAGRLVLRLLGAHAGVVAAATTAFALLVPLIVGESGSELRGSAMYYGLIAGMFAFGLLALSTLALWPRLSRVVHACEQMESPELPDREALYAAPRRATGLVGSISLGVLLAGYAPIGAPIEREWTIGTNVGAICAVLAALVLYATVRVALRPLVEALRADPEADADLEERGRPPADRLSIRVALAIAIPASAAALVVTVMVSAHLVAIAADQDVAAREMFNQALTLDRRPGESEAAVSVAASALRGAGVPLVEGPHGVLVAQRNEGSPRPPFWSIPIALIVALIAGQVGKRIGESGSMDVESAARRMAVVGAKDIRSVTMRMARPRSVPEIREMALALDTLAATLIRMADDQGRALTVRTEAARVRSFVLASVSHDLRGPLNSVLGFADLLISGVDGPLTPGQHESLEALSRGGRDLLRLVADLLDHARIDAGRMSVDRTRSPMDRIVERARTASVERAKHPMNEDEIAIEGEVGLYAIADEERVGNAIGALVAFALLRPGSDARVVIRMRSDGDSIAITIRGGGNTPSRDALSRMFEPFDFAPSGARAPAGLNLAVSVARGIIALHGGAVTAVPHEEGGVMLALTLPAARAQRERPIEHASAVGMLTEPTEKIVRG